MLQKTKPNKNTPTFSKLLRNQQDIWQAQITKLPANAKIKPLSEIKKNQVATRLPQHVDTSLLVKKRGKSYSERQQDNMNEGMLYGAGAYAGLFGACIVASGTVVSAPITVPAAIAGVGLLSAANALRKAYDITQEK
jgi:hypothetical protein